jgi:Rieske Fe-S protein
MIINRRQFLFLTALAAAGCEAAKDRGVSTAAKERVVNAGPVSDYAAEGVHGRFRDQGFFVVRQGGTLFAVSAICTHRKCKLAAEPDRSFHCPCHGSTFDPGGRVMKGPAKRDLPVFPVFTNESGQLLVRIPQT